MGLTLNLPDLVIWRIHIKISIDIHLATASYTAQNGAFVALFVDDSTQAQLTPLTNQYGQRYLMWDKIYLSEQAMNGMAIAAVTTTNTYQMYKTYDIRSRRKLLLQDTLFFQLVAHGQTVFDQFEVTYSVLLRIP